MEFGGARAVGYRAAIDVSDPGDFRVTVAGDLHPWIVHRPHEDHALRVKLLNKVHDGVMWIFMAVVEAIKIRGGNLMKER